MSGPEQGERPTEASDKLTKHKAFYTYDPVADAYYFAPLARAAGPYKTQRRMMAIVDVAQDGTLAGVELLPERGLRPPETV